MKKPIRKEPKEKQDYAFSINPNLRDEVRRNEQPIPSHVIYNDGDRPRYNFSINPNLRSIL